MPDITLVLIAVALVVFVFFQFRASRKRSRETAERQASIVPGVEIMTNYGLFGKVVSIDEANNFAFIEVSPGNVIKIHKSTILKPADPLVEEEPDEAPVAELNQDNAILASEPEFGERVAPKKPASKPTKKSGE